MKFSIMFWGGVEGAVNGPAYYTDLARLTTQAERLGASAVWLPERHFHPWGGMHPNPVILASFLAQQTSRMTLRAGSVVLPLHNPVRLTEDWSVVDNLSGGRVEIAFASGWRKQDFVLSPQGYDDRKQDFFAGVEKIRHLWSRDDPRSMPEIPPIRPRPIQPELPVWITSAGSISTFCDAGSRGYGVLTHLLGQNFDELAHKIRQHGGHAQQQQKPQAPVCLMLHTYIADSDVRAHDVTRAPMLEYLLASADISIKEEDRVEWDKLDSEDKVDLAGVSLDRYLDGNSLIGSKQTCAAAVARAAEAGVSEICCLIDFGLPAVMVSESLERLFAEDMAPSFA